MNVCDEREESSQTNQQLIISQKFNPDKKFNKLMIGSLQDSHLIFAWISVCQLERVCQAVLVKYFLVETLKIISDRDWGSRRWLCYQFELWLAEKNQGLSFIMAWDWEDASSEMVLYSQNCSCLACILELCYNAGHTHRWNINIKPWEKLRKLQEKTWWTGGGNQNKLWI